MEFSYRFMNTNRNAHGRGFYFTEDMEYADGYKKDGGQLLKGYLNIEKPASESKKTMKRAEIAKLVKAICKAEAEYAVKNDGYDSIDEALRDTFVSNYVDTYSAYSMDSVYREVANIIFEENDNDVDILAELTNCADVSTVLSIVKKTIGYDGIIYDNGNGTHQFVSFTSNQFKNADNKKPTANSDIRFALSDTVDGEEYSYDSLIKKKDMKIVELPNEIPMDGVKVDRKKVLEIARQNAVERAEGKRVNDTVSVYVPEIKKDVVLTANGIKHGLDRGIDESAYSAMNIGEILKNSIVVNELNPRKNTDMSYVFLGIGENVNGYYATRFVVSKLTNKVTKAEFFNLYAIKAKRNGKRLMVSMNNNSSTHIRHSVSTISISDFLESVKHIPLINEVFSKDVAKKLGVERSKGSLSDSLRYALSGEKKVYTKKRCKADH